VLWVRLLQVHPHAEMGDQGATQLADSLRQNQLLEVLILGSQKIGPDGAEAIGKALQKHQALRELHLHKNNLGYHGVERMARAMAEAWTERSSRPGNKIIKVLVLRHNGIAPCCGDCALCRGQARQPQPALPPPHHPPAAAPRPPLSLRGRSRTSPWRFSSSPRSRHSTSTPTA